MKKVLSMVMVLVMMLSLNVPAMAASAVEGTHGSITMMIEGEEITYTSYEVDGVVYVTYEQDGVQKVVSHNKQCDVVSLEELGMASSRAYSDENWKKVEGSETSSNVVADVSDFASVMATLIAVVGGAGIVALVPDGSDILNEMASIIIEEALPNVYYQRTTYYEVPIVTSRPNLGYIYAFYKDRNHKKSLGMFDACV